MEPIDSQLLSNPIRSELPRLPMQPSADTTSIALRRDEDVVVISQRAAKRAMRDMEFICKQLHRFARMSLEEHKSYARDHPIGWFCQIPSPGGKGHLLCGHLAWEKFGALADLALGLDQDVGRRVGRQRARDAVVEAFSKRVLLAEDEINEGIAESMLLDVLASLKGSLVCTEHYLPCVLFPSSGPDEFSVGPVTFTRRKKFFRDRKSALRSSIDVETAAHIRHVDSHVAKGFPRERACSAHESRQLVRELQARAIRAYRQYPWIASVKVRNCDEGSSPARATRAVEMAIHVVRIILGGENTRKIRLAWSQSPALRTAHLQSDAFGVIRASTSANSMGPVGTDKWYEAMMRSTWELEMLGVSLTPIVEPRDTSHLHHRLMDAISWFGDAATDPNTSSSIIKYVSAIERLLFGKFGQGRRKAFADRVSSVMGAFGCDNDHKIREQALAVYDLRSALVHGERQETNKGLRKTAALSRMCLLCSTQLYLLMQHAFGKPDPAKLEEVMKRICNEGVEWLIEAAGQKKQESAAG